MATTVVFEDQFVESAGHLLNFGTNQPETGSSPGWAQRIGSIWVDGAVDDRAKAYNTSAGNRYIVSTDNDIGRPPYEVEAAFRDNGDTSNVFFGLIARNAETGISGTRAEFTYDHGLSGGSWNLLSDQLVESWPGDPTVMKLVCLADESNIGYAGGVEKVSGTTSTSNWVVGILLGKFGGGSTPSPPWADYFIVRSWDRELEGYRWREDDGNESGASWAAPQDTDIRVGEGGELRLRMILQYPQDGDEVYIQAAEDGTEDWFDLDIEP